MASPPERGLGLAGIEALPVPIQAAFGLQLNQAASPELLEYSRLRPLLEPVVDRGGAPQALRPGFSLRHLTQNIVSSKEHLAVTGRRAASLTGAGSTCWQQQLDGGPQGWRRQKIGVNRSFIRGCGRAQPESCQVW